MNRYVLSLLLCATATLAQAQDESPKPKTSKPVAARVVVSATAATPSVRGRVLLTTASKQTHDLAEPAKPTGRLLASLAGKWVQVRGASQAKTLRDVALEGRVRKAYKAGVPIFPTPNAQRAPVSKLGPAQVVWCKGGPPGWLVCKGGYVLRKHISFSRKAPEEPADKDEADKPAAKGAGGQLGDVMRIR